jgi:predicted lactoylglutathione lyase
MTAREVFICMSNISKRKNNDMIMQAKLHGMEIKDSPKEKMKISKEQDDLLSKHLERINKERFGK